MPELPEVETIRRGLLDAVVGQTVRRVTVRRPDIITGDRRPAALLRGQRVVDVRRHGKQLAILGDGGQVVCVHLGMTGGLRLDPAGRRPAAPPRHIHLVWYLTDQRVLRFQDARRFGGIWTFPGLAALTEARWARLGPDALSIRPAALHAALGRTTRSLKAALLDQAVVAGLGNIYVDELLFRSRLHPLTRADTLAREQVRGMIRQMRRLLGASIDVGGTTLRDFADDHGRAGGFRPRLRVYGRAGQPCIECSTTLMGAVIAQRMTVWCPACQGDGPGGSSDRACREISD